MKDFAKAIVDMLDGRVDYGDVRIVQILNESIRVKNGKVESIASSEDMGFGVRVLVNGYWGFASSNKMDIVEAERVVKAAIEIAEASALGKGEPIRLSAEEVFVDTYRTPFEKDPFAVPLHEKIDLLLRVDKILREEKAIKLAVSSLRAYRLNKIFASTEGALIEQEIVETGGGYTAYAISENDLQFRSYPAAFGGNFATAGWEFIEELEFEKHAPRIAEEAAKLLTAPPAPEGIMDVVIGSHQMALQVHESIGHAVELDRVLGYEASYAGTSFVTLDKLGTFRYGSELMNVYADATTPRGLGTFGYDDEGVKAQRVPIVKDGIFAGYLSSRETAVVIGRKSSGAMRASSWNRIPLIRMTNINLEPGDLTFEELIGEVKDGLFVPFSAASERVSRTGTWQKMMACKVDDISFPGEVDAALLDSGVGNTNLVKVSSILPPFCEEVSQISIPEGSLVPVAYAYLVSDKVGEIISAAVAVGIPKERSKAGLIMEVSGKERKGEVEKKAIEMIKEGMEKRKIKEYKIVSLSIEHRVQQIGAVFAGVVLWR